MNCRKGLAGIVVVMLAVGSTCMADETSSVAQIELPAPLSQPVYADASTASTTPIMMGLDAIGIGKTLEDWHINITGWAEGGYFYDFTKPRDGASSPAKSPPTDGIQFPGAYKNSFDPDQIDLSIARAVDPTKWDIGFYIEGNAGRDAAFFHSNGIYDNTVKDGTGGFSQPDLLQAFIQFGIPIGSGLTVNAGKFVTIFGDETINPTTNYFYTHSYNFSYGIPFTETGITGQYNLTSEWGVLAGITRGWNETTSDNNGDPDFISQITWKPTNSKWSWVGNVSVGPEGVPGTLPYGPKDNKDNWAVGELIPTYKLSDNLTLVGDFLYGYANSFSQWMSADVYASYMFNSMFTFNLRAEIYHDGHSGTIFAAAPNGVDINYYEATIGSQITPLPDDKVLKNLQIRPELRYDYASKPVYDLSRKWSELTAAVDVSMKF